MVAGTETGERFSNGRELCRDRILGLEVPASIRMWRMFFRWQFGRISILFYYNNQQGWDQGGALA